MLGRGPRRELVAAGAITLSVAAVVPAVLSAPSPAAADPPSVAMVVGNPAALTAGENRMRLRWGGDGYVVEVLDDDTVTSAQVEAHSFGFISWSVVPTASAVRALADVGVPLWAGRSAFFDDFGLTGYGSGEYGTKTGDTVTIADETHPAAAGYTGDVVIQNATQKVSWGAPADEAAVVATSTGVASVFTLETGDELDNGIPAPSCRMSFPVVGNAPATYTTDGWAMFEAMTQWAVDCPPPPQPTGDVEQVVLVSMDGLNPKAITTLGPAGAPNFHQMMDEGASTLNARTVFEKTETLPNHTSMVTSRRVALPEGTGVTFNTDNLSTVHVSAGGYVPSVFDVVHDAGGSTRLFTTKSKFNFLNRSWNDVNGAPDVTGADDGSDKIDEFWVGASATMTTRLIEDLQTTRPTTFSMLHLRDPDSAGHAFGWMSPEYLAAVQAVDTQLGRLLDAIATDSYLSQSTAVVLTVDHGGISAVKAHGDPTHPDNYTIPFVVWGFEVAAGADLYALNLDDRTDPLTTRPDYDDLLPQPIRNAEAGNLATDLLGLPVIPTSELGTDQDLDVS